MPTIQVPINNTLPWTQAIATPGQTVFSTNWTADVATDVVVYSRSDGVEADDATQIVSSNDYNVAFIGSNEYVQVTFLTPRAEDDIVTIMRNTPADRLNLYINTNFTPTMLNGDFGRQVMMIQQRVLCDNALAVKYNNSETLNPNQIADNILAYLPPGYGWMKNLANTRIIAAPFGGGGGGGNQIVIVVTQPNHGFIADQVVYFDSGTQEYALALTNNAATAEVIGIVASVADVNHFTMVVGGEFDTTNLVLVPGGVYFVSDVTPGLLTLTEPTTSGHISKPIAIANGTNSAVFYNFRGKIINNIAFPWNAVTTNTNLVPDQNYYLTGGGALQLLLPALCTAGAEIEIKGFASASWRLVQNAGQVVHVGDQVTTTGIAGYVESQNAHDGIRLLCVVTNTTFTVLSGVSGNLTVI